MVLSGGPGLSPDMLDSGINSFFIRGYINHRGIPMQPVNEREIKDIDKYFREENISQIGILRANFPPVIPRQELTALEMLKNNDRHFSLGHRLSGHLNLPAVSLQLISMPQLTISTRTLFVK